MLETWDLDLNGIENVPAYLARPKGTTGRPRPCSSTTRTAAATRSASRNSSTGEATRSRCRYAKELTGLGYVSLAIDHWVFGERSHTTEPDMFKEMLWKGQVLWGMMVYDSLRAMDFLVQRPDVDPARSPRSASRWAAPWPGGSRPSTSA